ncbi:MAG: SpoVR family protein [Spirochaetota bacterium]|nr:SpoVR family protein [Spirochaetota bacterium]
MNLTPELDNILQKVREVAVGYGLDFFDTIFELVDYNRMNEIASYGGFPTRYPHWKFGMEFEQLSKGYSYGLQKIYEMVINNDPCYAYLMESNETVDQKLVMAHVFGHSDFFKNNSWFSSTNRKAIDTMANHGSRVRMYIKKHGYDSVERFLDCCLSIENLIDPYSPFIKRRKEPLNTHKDKDNKPVKKIESKQYMDSFINPEDFIESQQKKLDEEKAKEKHFPEKPEKDVLLFLLEHAPLEKWQQNILSIIREESYYFAPQAQTKIMNEGWASYWHSTIMTSNILVDSEVIDYADHHSGTLGVSPGQINPYKLGIELFRDIEDRWNKGKFGKDYDLCEDYEALRRWDKGLGLGREKIFEVRQIHNDITFIDAFLTKEFVQSQKMFTYAFDRGMGTYVITDRDFKKIKNTLLFNLTNMGQPFIYVLDGNYKNRGELYLKHRYEGIPLKKNYARDTLKNINALWGRPVNLETVEDNKDVLISFDGTEYKEVYMGLRK